MTATDIAAWLGAITGTLVLLWDVYKWLHKGPRLHLNVATNMTLVGVSHLQKADGLSVMVEVCNVGDAGTTLTHLILKYYSSRLDFLLRREAEKTFVVPDPGVQQFPAYLKQGDRWVGMIEQTDEIEQMAKNGYLCVGVLHSSVKQPVIARVIMSNRDIDCLS